MSGFSLKDHLFNKKSVTYFADLFYIHNKKFSRKKFIQNIIKDFPYLELKERIQRIVRELEVVLPADYPKALNIILQALPPELDPTKSDDDFGEFIISPLSEFIACHGCTKEYLDISLHALRECTKRFSVEFPIRHFINAFPEETYAFLFEGTQSNNYHVRRLSSEGLRPSLPWAVNINFDYRKSIIVLDQLFFDQTRYVTRSVANHMNDISKIDPQLVITTLKKWKQSGKQNKKEIDFIMNHSLRTLIKKGYGPALELLGYPTQAKIDIKNIIIHTPIVLIGSALEFSFDLISGQKQNLIIDYIVHYQSKSGSTSEKVFKIKKCSLVKGQTLSLSKKQPFRIMTTKKLYPGVHEIELQINGVRYQIGSFNLVEPGQVLVQ